MFYQFTVLFVCTGNSARSQIAEAMLRHMDSQNFAVASAGTHPKAINPKALEVLEAVGISTEGLYSKSLASLADRHFDVVITLCDKAAQECQLLTKANEVLAWNLEDPATSSDPRAFEHTLQAIHERITLFVLIKTKRN